MPYPTDTAHRHSRRRLGRGQYPRPRPIVVTVDNTGDTALIVFSAPVQVKGLIDLAIAGRTPISQSIATPLNVSITYNGNLATRSWSLPSPPSNVTAPTGATIIGATGDFGGIVPIANNNVLIADGSGGMVGGRGTILGDGSVSLATNTFTIDPAGNVAATSFAGDGSGITGLDFGQIAGTPPNPFDQDLNTANSVAFNGVTSPEFAHTAGGQSVTLVGDVGVNLAVGATVRCALTDAAGMVLNNYAMTATTYYGDASHVTGLSYSQLSGTPSVADITNSGGNWYVGTGASPSLTTSLQALNDRIAALEAILAAGISGTSTPTTGTTTAVNGIVTAQT